MSRAVEIKVTAQQRVILKKLTQNKADTPYLMVERARIILRLADGVSKVEQGRILDVDRQRVRRWRTRWSESEGATGVAEKKGATDKHLSKLLLAPLTDEERPGVPSKFTAEQLTQIVGVACETPEECGRPVTHWTPVELAADVIQRGIVESISPRHIGRVPKGGICDRTRASIG